MCTRLVYNGDNTVVGFNFDIDLSVWKHTVIAGEDRFFIGIKMLDHRYHSFHGINRNGNVGILLYVHGNKNGEYCSGEGYMTVADAFSILNTVRQEELWATRVSFVYSVKENRVSYALNNDFKNIIEYRFDRNRKQEIFAKKTEK